MKQKRFNNNKHLIMKIQLQFLSTANITVNMWKCYWPSLKPRDGRRLIGVFFSFINLYKSFSNGSFSLHRISLLLAPPIAAPCFYPIQHSTAIDVKDVEIKIETQKNVKMWQKFLKTFVHCKYTVHRRRRRRFHKDLGPLWGSLSPIDLWAVHS